MTDLRTQLQSTLGNGYTLERELGGGGMSRVFLAREEALGRQVVVKLLSPELSATLSAERFTREIKLAAALQEPHIVPVLAAGMTAEGLPYYTMPFVRGDSLRTRLLAGPVPLAEALEILRNIGQALAYAHERGIVHRDIKPENVLLSSGTAIVTDFGIAKAVSASATIPGDRTLTSAGTSIGTPAYMAPEQAVGDAGIDHRADLYSWGVVAYELLSGNHPFAAHASASALVAAHLTETPRSLSDGRTAIPLGVANLVMQCLEKDPTRRPANAGALLARLGALGASPAAPAPVTSDARSTKSRSAQVVVLSVAIVAAVVIFGLWRRNVEETKSAAAELHSIAVLPFADLSADASTTRLGEGVAETMINALAQVPGLTVSARTSAFSLRDQQGDVQAIGRQLNVVSVLTGSIQRSGDQLRVTARVVRVANDSILWSDVFDRPVSDFFAVQDEVARAVTAALRLRVAAQPGAMREVSGTRSAVAYDAYILGRYFWNQRTTDGMRRATEAFQKAIAADSNYAQAWSGLADSYSLSIPGEFNVPGLSRDTLLARAERAARRAIALAPTLADGHVSLGETMSQLNLNAEAVTAFERGVALNPSYATGHQWLSYALLERGQWDAGIREMEIAHRLDPLAPVITLSLAVAYDGANRFDDAAPLYAQGLSQAPNQWYGWRFRLAHDLARGDFAAAQVALREAVKDTGHPTWPAWRDLARAPADSAGWRRASEPILRDGSWDLSVPLARWLRDEAATVDAVVTGLQKMRVFSGWGAQALVGPRIRTLPPVVKALRAAGAPVPENVP